MAAPSVFHPQLGYGIPVSAELPVSGEWPHSGELEDEIIGRGDSRSPVKDTTKMPYRWICQIIATVQDPAMKGGAPTPFIGTGLLISPRHVLTAAHTVWFQKDGGVYRAKQVEVSPGRSRGSKPFGTYRVTGAKFPKEYAPVTAGSCYDYALLTLDESIGGKRFKAIGNEPLAYWGSGLKGHDTRLEYVEPAALRKKAVHVVGYAGDKCGFLPIVPFKPGDRCYDGRSTPGDATLKQCLKNGLAGSAQYGDKGRVLDMRSGGPAQYLIYDADTCGAQSGAPVWMQSGGKRYLVGIHTGAFHQAKGTCADATAGARGDANRAIRIDRTVLRNVMSWIPPQ